MELSKISPRQLQKALIGKGQLHVNLILEGFSQKEIKRIVLQELKRRKLKMASDSEGLRLCRETPDTEQF
jgi:hypothetical protein